MDALQTRAEVAGVLPAAGRHAGGRPGGVALRVPAGGGVAAGRTQTQRLAVGEGVVARDGEGGSGADVQVLVLQGVPAMAVVLAGGSDFNPGAQGHAWWASAVQVVSGLLPVKSRKDPLGLVVVGGAVGLDPVRGGPIQGEGLLRLRTEDLVRSQVRVIWSKTAANINKEK